MCTVLNGLGWKRRCPLPHVLVFFLKMQHYVFWAKLIPVRRAELAFQLLNLVAGLICWEPSRVHHMLQLIKSPELHYLRSSDHVADVNGSHYSGSLWEEDLEY